MNIVCPECEFNHGFNGKAKPGIIVTCKCGHKWRLPELKKKPSSPPRKKNSSLPRKEPAGPKEIMTAEKKTSHIGRIIFYSIFLVLALGVFIFYRNYLSEDAQIINFLRELQEQERTNNTNIVSKYRDDSKIIFILKDSQNKNTSFGVSGEFYKDQLLKSMSPHSHKELNEYKDFEVTHVGDEIEVMCKRTSQEEEDWYIHLFVLKKSGNSFVITHEEGVRYIGDRAAYKRKMMRRF